MFSKNVFGIHLIKSKLINYSRYFSGTNAEPVVLSTVTHRSNVSNPEFDKTLLIIHGLFGSKQNWNSLSKNLSQHFKQIIAVDLRNHGDSPHSVDMSIQHMAADIGEVISRTLGGNGNNLVVVGHSIGGKVGMYFALTRPESISALVVVDISPIGAYFSLDFRSIIESLNCAPINQSVSLTENRSNLNQYLESTIKDASVRGFLLTNLVKNQATNQIGWRVNLKSIMAHIDHMVSFPTPSNTVFHKPTLFIGGERSDYIRQEHWGDILKLFPAASLSIVPGAGHWVHADKPHDFLKLIVQFVQTLDAN